MKKKNNKLNKLDLNKSNKDIDKLFNKYPLADAEEIQSYMKLFKNIDYQSLEYLFEISHDFVTGRVSPHLNDSIKKRRLIKNLLR